MNEETKQKTPHAYFLTFTTYGNWLPGDKRLSVNRKKNVIATPKTEPNIQLHETAVQNQKQQTIKFNARQRTIVLNTTQSVCKHYEWMLLAAHIRSNHVHIVVQSDKSPEFVMKQIKAYCTRHLRKDDTFFVNQTVWTRHGSTRYIWESCKLFPVMKYVIEEQGDKMACYYQPWYDDVLRIDDDFF